MAKSLERILGFFVNQRKRKRKMAKLNLSQMKKLKAHSAHHTPKHMKEMKVLMRDGKSFDQAHKLAMKKVGK